MSEAIIEHQGIVDQIVNRTVFVRILSQTACANCHAKGVCTGIDSEEKVIEITTPNADKYTSGQKVIVSITQKLGFLALFWGYLLPFLLIMTTLITAVIILGKQEIAGIFSIAILVPYYTCLYFFRHKLKTIFQFEIK